LKSLHHPCEAVNEQGVQILIYQRLVHSKFRVTNRLDGIKETPIRLLWTPWKKHSIGDMFPADATVARDDLLGSLADPGGFLHP
jgi:hypothetical protein